MSITKKSFFSFIKSFFIVCICVVILSMPIIDAHRAYAIAGIDDAVLCSVGVALAGGLLVGASMTLASKICTDPYIQQKTAEFGQTVTDGSKKIFRTTVGKLKQAKAYLFNRLDIKHDVPTPVPTTSEPVTPPNIFDFNTVEYPSDNITYKNDGITVSNIAFDASFLSEHVLWETGQQSLSVDSRTDPFYSSLQEGYYFTASSTISGHHNSEYCSNVFWVVGDLQYGLSHLGNNYYGTVAWHVYEPLYFVNQGTGKFELLLSASMTGIANQGPKFFYVTTPIRDMALNASASNWYEGAQPPLKAFFGMLNPSIYKTYSQTALNYREYSYELWSGNAVEATTTYEPTTLPPIGGGKYDSDYDITQIVKDDNAYVNIPITPEIETVIEAVVAGTDYSDFTVEQKRSLRDLSKSVYNSVTVGGDLTTTEEVTDSTGAVITPAVTTVTGAIPLTDYFDSSVTDTGEYQGIFSRIATTTRSILDTAKSIPQTISGAVQGIIDAVEYQFNPNSPHFYEPFMPFVFNTFSEKFPIASDFQSSFSSLASMNSPLVLDYDIIIGDRTFHFSANFSWFEPHRSRFRAGVGVLFWLLAWLAVLRSFLSVFQIGLGKVAGIDAGHKGAGGSSGASSLDIGGSASSDKGVI